MHPEGSTGLGKKSSVNNIITHERALPFPKENLGSNYCHIVDPTFVMEHTDNQYFIMNANNSKHAARRNIPHFIQRRTWDCVNCHVVRIYEVSRL